jgi:dynein heavy chain
MSILTYYEEIKLNAKEELNRKHIEKLFLWAFCWAIGSTLTSDTVDVFERMVTESFPLEILPRGSVMDYLIKISKNNDGVVSVEY